MSLSIRWTGKDEFIKALRLMTNLDVPINEAATEYTHKVVEDAKMIVPVKTGRLRNNIRSYNRGNSHIVEANTEYAGYVEFGTSRQNPQPYLFPSLLYNKSFLEEELYKRIYAFFKNLERT
jgi:HK97 gp10 family phage protein